MGCREGRSCTAAHPLNARLPPIVGRQFEQFDFKTALKRRNKIDRVAPRAPGVASQAGAWVILARDAA